MVLQRSTPLEHSIPSASTPAIPTSVPSAHSLPRPKSLIPPTDTDPDRHSKHIDSRASSGGLAQRNFKQGAIDDVRICGISELGTLLKILCTMQHPGLCLISTCQPPFTGLLALATKHSLASMLTQVCRWLRGFGRDQTIQNQPPLLSNRPRLPILPPH